MLQFTKKKSIEEKRLSKYERSDQGKGYWRTAKNAGSERNWKVLIEERINLMLTTIQCFICSQKIRQM